MRTGQEGESGGERAAKEGGEEMGMFSRGRRKVKAAEREFEEGWATAVTGGEYRWGSEYERSIMETSVRFFLWIVPRSDCRSKNRGISPNARICHESLSSKNHFVPYSVNSWLKNRCIWLRLEAALGFCWPLIRCRVDLSFDNRQKELGIQRIGHRGQRN